MLGLAAVAHAEKTRPNILFIMSDDHTSQAVGVYGGRLQALNPTPTLDKLAAEGIVMENAFCTNAICTPSRACIMTGQYSAVNGVTDLNGKLEPARQYLAHEMKQAGYQTAVIGKWHLKERPEAFDYYKVLHSQGDYFDPFFYERGATETVTKQYWWGPATYKNVTSMQGHSTDCIADSALEWFQELRDPDQPFFLKLQFKAPHDYFEYAPRYEDYLADVEIPEPASMWNNERNGSIATRGVDDELLPYIGTSVGARHYRRNMVDDENAPWAHKVDRSLTGDAAKKQAYQLYLKAYLRCVKGVDDNVKRVLDYMEREGILDNTVVIYTGDQGFYLGEHDYIDKRWGYEEAMRMPFIVRYPKGIPAGTRSDAIVENVDYPAMMLDYAGVDTPDYMQGRSFRSIMESGKEPKDWKQAAYYHYWMHMVHHENPAHIGIRTKKFKLLYFYGAAEDATEAETPPAWELYDLENDPQEMNNLYENPEYAQIIEQLKGQLKALRADYGEDDPKFACNAVIDEFWDYGEEARAKAEALSAEYLLKIEAQRKAKQAETRW